MWMHAYCTCKLQSTDSKQSWKLETDRTLGQVQHVPWARLYDANFAKNTSPMLGDGVRVVSRGDGDVPLPEADTPPPAALYGSAACGGSSFGARWEKSRAKSLPTGVIAFARSGVVALHPSTAAPMSTSRRRDEMPGASKSTYLGRAWHLQIRLLLAQWPQSLAMEPSWCFMFGASVGGLMGLCLSGRLVLFLLLLIPKGSCHHQTASKSRSFSSCLQVTWVPV